jgi:homoserine dehydrogenase
LAQEVGYAESNPKLDVEGIDACNKLIILIAHAFGLVLKPESILTIGIDKIGDLELRYAREKGYKIKLIAQAIKHHSDEISAIVAPQFVRPDSPLFRVDDVYNGVITETVFADRQFFSGKGAGDFPTASAVLSDLSALSYDYKYEYRKLNQNFVTKLSDDVSIDVFVSGDNEYETLLRPYFNVLNELYKYGKNC